MTRHSVRASLVVLALCVTAAGAARAADTPALVSAARNGDTDSVRSLLVEGADVDAVSGDGTTALHWASYRDDVELVALLLDAEASVNVANDLGATALWSASQNGSVAMAGRLLEAGADPNAALLSGETPLMVGARAGAAKVVELLLEYGAETDTRAARGQTALMWAAAQQHADVVTTLLAGGADIHAKSDVWSQVMAVPPHSQPEYKREIPHGGNTALMFAARGGALATARVLIAAGADVDDMDAWGVSATTVATHAGFADVVELLLEAGADANAADAGFAAIHPAVMRQDERLVELLLSHGADPNATLRTWTPIRRSSRDFNFAPPLVGATPFWLAARFAAPSIMRLLVQYGADPAFVHHPDYKEPTYFEPRLEETTALMAVVGMGGGRLRGWFPPPRREAETRALEAAELLVELGADLHATDADGRTAVDGARAAGLRSVAAFLESKGGYASAGW
jgi:ankyrin repeat protein